MAPHPLHTSELSIVQVRLEVLERKKSCKQRMLLVALRLDRKKLRNGLEKAARVEFFKSVCNRRNRRSLLGSTATAWQQRTILLFSVGAKCLQ